MTMTAKEFLKQPILPNICKKCGAVMYYEECEACEDEYYRALGDLVEQHPIRTARIRKG